MWVFHTTPPLSAPASDQLALLLLTWVYFWREINGPESLHMNQTVVTAFEILRIVFFENVRP